MLVPMLRRLRHQMLRAFDRLVLTFGVARAEPAGVQARRQLAPVASSAVILVTVAAVGSWLGALECTRNNVVDSRRLSVSAFC